MVFVRPWLSRFETFPIWHSKVMPNNLWIKVVTCDSTFLCAELNRFGGMNEAVSYLLWSKVFGHQLGWRRRFASSCCALILNVVILEQRPVSPTKLTAAIIFWQNNTLRISSIAEKVIANLKKQVIIQLLYFWSAIAFSAVDDIRGLLFSPKMLTAVIFLLTGLLQCPDFHGWKSHPTLLCCDVLESETTSVTEGKSRILVERKNIYFWKPHI